jgi:hypothetical protein
MGNPALGIIIIIIIIIIIRLFFFVLIQLHRAELFTRSL